MFISTALAQGSLFGGTGGDGGKTFNFLPGADGAPVNSGGPGLDIITAVVAKNQ